MRAEGTGFLSFSILQQDDGRTEAALFAEYGLRPRLTLGVKADLDMTAGQMGDGTIFVFARKPLGSEDRPYRLAYELALGTRFGQTKDPLLRTGLSYGRGLTLGQRNGWLAVDGAVEWSLGKGTDVYKLDTTFGVTLNDRFKVMAQVFLSSFGDTQETTFAPSLIWQPRPNRPSYQIGLEVEEGSVALRLGLWADF